MNESSHFPTVGVFASPFTAHFLTQAASGLGVQIFEIDSTVEKDKYSECDVVTVLDQRLSPASIKTLELAEVNFTPSASVIERLEQLKRDLIIENKKATYEIRFQIQVARSAHAQISTWAPTSIRTVDDLQMTITPSPEINSEILESAQRMAIELSGEFGLVGSAYFDFALENENLKLIDLSLGLSRFGSWSLHGSLTSQFEQHLRAILDLPLGDTALRAEWTVSSEIQSGAKQDMYRPYLHLMARTPAMKYWQNPGPGFMAISGSDLEFLIGEARHAIEYFKGEIDE